MAKIISFPRMKLGEVVKLEYNGHKFKCKILQHLGGDTYKVKALNGPYQGQTSILQMTRWEKDNE